MPSRKTFIPHSIRPFVRSIYYLVCELLIKAIHSKFLPATQIARKIIFTLSRPSSFLLSNGLSEIFVVSASDKVIGGLTYIRKKPYDFKKFETVLALLDDEHKKRLLIDIGANIGTICIPAIKRGLFQKAIAVEPDPKNYSLLMANIFLNEISDKIVVHNIALGQKDNESLIFELCGHNHGDHRISGDGKLALHNEGSRETINVKSETFDKVMGIIEADEALIFIDTQGYEGFIFAGASKALQKKTPICLEFWPYGMERSGGYDLLKKSLLSGAYSHFYNLDKNTPIATPLTEKALDDLYSGILASNLKDKEGTFFTDLLVI